MYLYLWLCLYSHLYLYLWLKLGGAGPVLIHDYQINPFCRGGAQPGMLHRHLLERRQGSSHHSVTEGYRVLQRVTALGEEARHITPLIAN